MCVRCGPAGVDRECEGLAFTSGAMSGVEADERTFCSLAPAAFAKVRCEAHEPIAEPREPAALP